MVDAIAVLAHHRVADVRKLPVLEDQEVCADRQNARIAGQRHQSGLAHNCGPALFRLQAADFDARGLQPMSDKWTCELSKQASLIVHHLRVGAPRRDGPTAEAASRLHTDLRCAQNRRYVPGSSGRPYSHSCGMLHSHSCGSCAMKDNGGPCFSASACSAGTKSDVKSVSRSTCVLKTQMCGPTCKGKTNVSIHQKVRFKLEPDTKVGAVSRSACILKAQR